MFGISTVHFQISRQLLGSRLNEAEEAGDETPVSWAIVDANFSQVDTLYVRYKSVNFRAGMGLGEAEEAGDETLV